MDKIQKLYHLELLYRMTRKSTLTEKDVQELAKKIDKNVAKKLGLLQK